MFIGFYNVIESFTYSIKCRYQDINLITRADSKYLVKDLEDFSEGKHDERWLGERIQATKQSLQPDVDIGEFDFREENFEPDYDLRRIQPHIEVFEEDFENSDGIKTHIDDITPKEEQIVYLDIY
jgi:hypothetical protein